MFGPVSSSLWMVLALVSVLFSSFEAFAAHEAVAPVGPADRLMVFTQSQNRLDVAVARRLLLACDRRFTRAPASQEPSASTTWAL